MMGLKSIGHYDTRTFPSFRFSLEYAQYQLIYENEHLRSYCRASRRALIFQTIIEDATGFELNQKTVDFLEEKRREFPIEDKSSRIYLWIFRQDNAQTEEIAQRVLTNNKKIFNHVLIYNETEVRLEYYRPVPNFYALYQDYSVAIYEDLAAIDYKAR